MRSSGWSEIEWLERDRAWQSALSLSELRRRRRSYAVVADGKHFGLVEERGNRRVREEKRKKMKKREGTGE